VGGVSDEEVGDGGVWGVGVIEFMQSRANGGIIGEGVNEKPFDRRSK
jgi:hypothetical protein